MLHPVYEDSMVSVSGEAKISAACKICQTMKNENARNLVNDLKPNHVSAAYQRGDIQYMKYTLCSTLFYSFIITFEILLFVDLGIR